MADRVLQNQTHFTILRRIHAELKKNQSSLLGQVQQSEPVFTSKTRQTLKQGFVRHQLEKQQCCFDEQNMTSMAKQDGIGVVNPFRIKNG